MKTFSESGEIFGLDLNPSESELFQIILNHFEPIRKTFCISFRRNNLTWSDSIRFNPRHQSGWIRTNPNQSEIGLIQIEFLTGALIGSNSFRLMLWIEAKCIGLGWIYFWPVFIKRERKRISYYFGMAWNSSDSLGLNSNPKLSLGEFNIC